MPSTEGGQFPFNGQERQLGPEGCYTIRLGFYVFSIKTPKGGKNILMGPISKNEDSKLMQMLRPSSTIYLCGLLPLRPKAYNLLTQSYIHIQHSLEQYMLPIASHTARVPFSSWVSVFHANRGRQCCLL